MRKTTKLFLGFTAGLLLLCGCSAAEEKLGYENADVAKEALTSAETIEIYFDLYGSKRKTKIVADGKVAAIFRRIRSISTRRSGFRLTMWRMSPSMTEKAPARRTAITTHPVRVLAMRRSSMWIPPMEKIQD